MAVVFGLAIEVVGLLLPAVLSLALFAWLLTLHPFAAGRTYAAYGGIYIAVALAWLWLIEGVTPTPWDIAGVAVALATNCGGAVMVTQAVALQAPPSVTVTQ